MGKKGDEYDQINKLLRSIQGEQLKHVVERVFQKVPTLASEIFEQIDQLPKTQRRNALVNEMVNKIKYFTENLDTSRELRMPTRATDYLKYINLLVVIQRSKAKTWRVYQFQNYKKPDDIEDLTLEVFGVESRYKLKSCLSKKGFASGIQTETDVNKIWFSVSYVKKSKNRENDKKKILRSKVLYMAYYPGESYLYIGGSRLPPELGEAFADSLGATGYVLIPLEGKHLDSLRQLRLNRDNKGKITAKKSLPPVDRFSVFAQPDTEQKDFPILDRVRTECQLDFRDLESVPHPEELTGKKMSIRLECNGNDVIGGFHDMVSAEMIRSNPVPRWILNLPTSGRNLFTLVPAMRKETDMELQSILSTASTVRNRNPAS